MDPAATVRRILAALAAFRWAEAEEAAADLQNWLARGGHTPNGWTGDETVAFLSAVDALANLP